MSAEVLPGEPPPLVRGYVRDWPIGAADGVRSARPADPLSPAELAVWRVAFPLADEWSAGRWTEGMPALWHVMRAVEVYRDLVPRAEPGMLGALLLHEAPRWVDQDDLTTTVKALLGRRALSWIWMLVADHEARLTYAVDPVEGERRLAALGDDAALAGIAADVVATIEAALYGAGRAANATLFWSRFPAMRPGGYFSAFARVATGRLPSGLAGALDEAVERAAVASAPAGLSTGEPLLLVAAERGGDRLDLPSGGDRPGRVPSSSEGAERRSPPRHRASSPADRVVLAGGRRRTSPAAGGLRGRYRWSARAGRAGVHDRDTRAFPGRGLAS